MAMVVARNPHLVGTYVGEEDVVRSESLPEVPENLLGTNGPDGGIVLVDREISLHLPADGRVLPVIEAQRSTFARRGVTALVQHPERVGEVSHELDFGMIMGIDLRRDEVGMDDDLVDTRVPEARGVLHHVVAEGDDEVGGVDGAGDEIRRFEGPSDPADAAVVFALTCPRTGLRGTFIAAYGATADPADTAVIRRLEEAAREHLEAIHRANAMTMDGEAWGFPELVHGRELTPGGTRHQGWSAGGAIIGHHALAGRMIFESDDHDA